MKDIREKEREIRYKIMKNKRKLKK